ncbi:hypothetical protein BDN71DRAFT_1441232 [Pleurotus eryngii]|uniref:Uncharacterized protein n=1 Tax=Pleurotus eryngii TaxID=5323 RepID=A0A9P6DCW2_PLEER|nr:hypothetical protein BDN71DRAFT_1441232 [Pleurotus eryngii]
MLRRTVRSTGDGPTQAADGRPTTTVQHYRGIGTIRASNKQSPAVPPPAISANACLTLPFRFHASKLQLYIVSALVRFDSWIFRDCLPIAKEQRCSYFIKSMFFSPRVGEDNFSSHKTSAVKLSQEYFSEFCRYWHAKFRRPLMPFNCSPTTAYTLANVLLTGVPT